MANIFENAWNKVSGEAGRREKWADSMMTYEEKMSSYYREKYLELKKKVGFSGEVTDAIIEELTVGLGEISYKIEDGGHKIEGSFRFHTCEEGCCWGDPLDNGSAKITINGKELSPEAARVYAEKNQEIIKMRVHGADFDRRAPDSVKRDIANQNSQIEKQQEEERIEEQKEAEKNAKLLEQEEKTRKATAELDAVLENKPQ